MLSKKNLPPEQQVIARPAPRTFTNPGEFEDWLSNSKLEPAPIEKMPTSWRKPLVKRRHGCILMRGMHLIRCVGGREKLFSFTKGAIFKGQIILLQPQMTQAA